MSDLASFWFAHPNLWFDASPEDDAQICAKYSAYLTDDPFDQMLYLDQILRHICRHRKIEYVTANTDRAVTIAQTLIDSEVYATPAHRVFILLPFRHTNLLEHVTFARNQVLKWMETTDSPLYDRFYRATVTRLAAFSKADLSTFDLSKLDERTLLDEFRTAILCPSCVDESFDPLAFDVTHSSNTTLDRQPTVISLSGGVDSMVCLRLAVGQGLDVVAVHINYGNRETADLEQKFVEYYCAKLKVPLYVRNITEIQRTRDRFRDFYEQVTHDIRFAAYRQFPERTVILGHNQTDCEENIFTNIKKWNSLPNLKGMTEYATIDGVRIYRPMLRISKSQMYDLAKLMRIPYLKNSTPTWSERGKIRDNILPVLDATTRERLLDLSDLIGELYETVQSQVDQIQFERTEEGIAFELTTQPNKIIFDLIFKKLGIYGVSKKNITHLVERFNAKPQMTVRLSKMFIKRDLNYYLIYP